MHLMNGSELKRDKENEDVQLLYCIVTVAGEMEHDCLDRWRGMSVRYATGFYYAILRESTILGGGKVL